jgi:hypothetical protein
VLCDRSLVSRPKVAHTEGLYSTATLSHLILVLYSTTFGRFIRYYSMIFDHLTYSLASLVHSVFDSCAVSFDISIVFDSFAVSLLSAVYSMAKGHLIVGIDVLTDSLIVR